ncbi:major capsid protein [Stutzerimonas stutzeri]|uniref:major capsid protein n=1 Tax=Stutzerimonas stutzeri TaxID=316 RepID=UPI00371B8BF7
MKQMNVVYKYGRQIAAAGAALVALPSFAAVTVIDTSEATGQIGEGATAAGVIGLGFIAFCILIGVFVKLRRAGS